MKKVIASIVVPALCFLAGCSVIPHYSHDLPQAYRTALYDASGNETLKACELALLYQGYNIALADSLSGVVYTDYRVIPPKSSEIGGEWRILCFLRVVELKDKSMVTAELVMEADGSPMSIDRGKARAAYRALFKDIQEQLDLGNQSRELGHLDAEEEKKEIGDDF